MRWMKLGRAAFALACALLALVATAQDARETTVLAAARDWLAVTDTGDAKASWNAAGRKFRDVIAVERWSEGLKNVRDPLGKLERRTAMETRFDDKFTGAPPGDYAIVVFRTSFEQKALSRETLTLERESDGAWRVIGYTVG